MKIRNLNSTNFSNHGLVGVVKEFADLPTEAVLGDKCTCIETKHKYTYNGSVWVDMGETTYYDYKLK